VVDCSLKAKLYLETTIPSYLVARPSHDLLVPPTSSARDWWEARRSEFDPYVSELVLDEVGAGDVALASQRLELPRDARLLTSTNEIVELTEDLIAELHRGIRRVVQGYGYEAPSLCTPEEMMGEEP